MQRSHLILLTLSLLTAACAAPDYDVIISNGVIYDGNGADPYAADVGINADTIAFIGDLSEFSGALEIDTNGMAVTPGFINMLSWAPDDLLKDGRSMGDIVQGVTLEVFGEGGSAGPLNADMKARYAANNDGEGPAWTTLMEFLNHLEQNGISTNVASFIGAATIRVHELKGEDRPPTPDELGRMKALVRQEMKNGAMGIGSSLIYAPGTYASTDELVELSKVAAEYDGMYISHMRSEGDRLLEALEELITISHEAGIRAQVYHLKAGGASNWHKMDQVIDRINEVRAEGMPITADMYTYIAGATGLDAHMPTWVQEGDFADWRNNLLDPDIRARVLAEMRTPGDDWENLGYAAGPEGVMVVGFRQDSLRYLIGKRLSEIAEERGTTPEDVAIDLVIADSTRVSTVYFLMSEENVKKQIALPWVSFDSDAGSMAPEGENLNNNPHPRAYGNFARLLAKYVRDEKVIPFQEAIRKLTSLPADNLRLPRRGRLQVGNYADIAIFDPDAIQDHATFEKPHQLSTGMSHVLVNGVQVLDSGQHTGAMPGRAVVRGEQ